MNEKAIYVIVLVSPVLLAHWGRTTHVCVGNLNTIGSDNGLPPGRRQAIIWTNAGILLIGPLRTNFSEILIEILTFSFRTMRLKVSSAKWRPFHLGLNVLKHWENDKGSQTAQQWKWYNIDLTVINMLQERDRVITVPHCTKCIII